MMNNHYKKLAMEAGMYVDLKGEPWPKWMGADECEIAYNKFAELLLQECVNTLFLNGYDDASNQLIKHFDVK